MSAISERLGGSKATLYGYFPSKEALFVACVEEDIDAETVELVDQVRAIPDLRRSLEYLGRQFLPKVTGDRPIAISRMVASQPLESRIGLEFYERGLKQGWLKLCVYFEELMAAGRLRQGNAWIMAMHLKGLFEGEYVERRMLNAMIHELDAETIERTARDAVDVFLRAYGPQSVAYPD
jgi:AcrR family transcriptional regulator